MNARSPHLIGAILLSLFAAASAAAQGPGDLPRYSPIPLPDDLKSALKQRLKHATGLESTHAFLKNLVNLKPDLFGPDFARNFDASSRQLIENYLESMVDPDSVHIPPDLLKKIQAGGIDIASVNEELLELSKQHFKPEQFKLDLPRTLLPDLLRQPAEPPDDPLKDWLKDLMERAEASQLGDYLRDSPAWQKTLQDVNNPALSSLVNHPLKKLASWSPSWRPQIHWRPNLQNVRLPGLGRLGWKPRLPSLPGVPFSVPQVGVPSLGSPSVSFSSPSSGEFQALGWGMLILMGCFLAWKWRPPMKGKTPGKAFLGAWPVPPREVSTRRQLVQAFDYLALSLLGPEAVSWNHRRAAANIGKDEAGQQAAQRLAGIYESARYTEGPQQLPEREREWAQRDLCLLAGPGARSASKG